MNAAPRPPVTVVDTRYSVAGRSKGDILLPNVALPSHRTDFQRRRIGTTKRARLRQCADTAESMSTNGAYSK